MREDLMTTFEYFNKGNNVDENEDEFYEGRNTKYA